MENNGENDMRRRNTIKRRVSRFVLKIHNAMTYRYRNISLACSAIAILSLLLVSCGAEKNLKKAEKYLAIGEYYDAATQFKQAYSKTPPKERQKRGQI